MLNQISRKVFNSLRTQRSAGLNALAARCSSHSSSSDVARFPAKHVADMDDMPVPSGSWQEYYDQRQKRFNIQLIASLSLFIGTAIYLQQTVFFNAFPPELPEEMKKGYYPWKERLEE